MKQIRVYHVDAFTPNPFEGNPARVVPDASHLTKQIQKIANQLNLPETAFILPAADPKANFRIRYFTPQEEIRFCGHATVASVWLLVNKYGWAEKTDSINIRNECRFDSGMFGTKRKQGRLSDDDPDFAVSKGCSFP
ncbi:PhzF family phenazine biosynthesis protein [Paenibacillus sp. IHBB 3054]|uniref:PhzF family phenazine biosynthesis protein n=1 Tax=Paenibacillus sp. IHBB 3054 TaxID=3425689 RepID=UPI003F676770